MAVLGLPGAAVAAGAASPTVATVVGTGRPGSSGEGGPATSAQLDQPTGIAVDAAGDLFVADTDSCRVVEVPAAAGTHYGIAMVAHHAYVVAGDGCHGGRGSVGYPTGVAVDAAGALFVADPGGNRVLELSPSGRRLGPAARAARLATAIGTGAAGSSGEGGPAASAELDQPTGIGVDAAGDLFVADTSNCRVVEVPATSGTRFGVAMVAHHAYVVAGTGTCGTAGLGGPARQAELYTPTAVVVDAAGDLLVADRGAGYVVEEPAAAGTYFGTAIGQGDLAAVAGMPIYGSYISPKVPATSEVAELNFLEGLALAPDGDLFATDTTERAIREVAAVSGTSFGEQVTAGDLYTVIGGVTRTFTDNTTKWVTAAVTTPYGVAMAPDGDLYFSDRGADTVREIRP